MSNSKKRQAGPKGAATPTKAAATSGDVAGGAPFSWVDETLPDLVDVWARNPEVDGAALQAWLGPRMGLYRQEVEPAYALPLPEAERQYLAELHSTSDRLRALLRTTTHRPLALDRLHFAAKGMGIQWQAMCGQLRADLHALAAVALTAEASLRGVQSTRGRKPMLPRDMLLAELVQQLRDTPMKADAARHVASEILERCKVEVPLIKSAYGTRATRRAETRGQKRP
jgi:hypothetical protein